MIGVVINIVGGPCDGQRVHPIPDRSADRPIPRCWICRPVTDPDRPWPGPFFAYHIESGRYVWEGQTVQ